MNYKKSKTNGKIIMEEGKLYESVYNGVVVKCTTKENCNLFGGVVVQVNNSNFKVGYACDSWLCEAFKEYTPTQVLTNGHSYNIPYGCKATIEEECKAEAELWDIQHEGYFGVQDTIKLIDDIKVEMFDRGVKYANRWIDVSDKRPNLQQLVLVKYQTDEVALAIYTGGLHGSTMFKQKCEDSTFGKRAVQWKPID